MVTNPSHWWIRDKDARDLVDMLPYVIMRDGFSVAAAQDMETANFIVYACNKQGNPPKRPNNGH